MKKYIIIVAGGTGSRMQSEIPKQFIEVGGTPILMHTIHRFSETFPSINIILVLHSNFLEQWENLIKKHHFTIVHQVVSGGKSRFQSVKNGLDKIQFESGFVGIHDAVRPFVSVAAIQNVFEVAKQKSNCILAVPLKDSIREVVSENENKALDRAKFRLVQTPQVFEINLLKKAYQQKESSLFTDDASVVENLGVQIHLAEGNYENIKITTISDLNFAEFLFQKESRK